MRPVRTLPDALAVAAQTQASYVFVGSGVDRQRPLADIYQAALRVAASLTALGLRRGDLVALIIADAESFLTALYGASIAGVTPASLYPPATTSDLPRYLEATTSILRSCAARAVVTTPGLQPHIDGLRTACPDLSYVLSTGSLDAPPCESHAN